MDPHRLAVWTSIGVNYSTYKPTDEEILARYLLKFSKGGKATAAELHQVLVRSTSTVGASSNDSFSREGLLAHSIRQLRSVLEEVVLQERKRIRHDELGARRDAGLETAVAVLAHFLHLEPGALHAVTEIVHRCELYDDAHETLLFVGGWAAIPVLARHRRVLADGDGRLRQHRPEARACQGSLLGSLLRFWSRHGPRIAGRQETKKKTLLQVARGTHKHQRTGFFNDNVVANCYANEERLDTPSGRAAGSRSTKYD